MNVALSGRAGRELGELGKLGELCGSGSRAQRQESSQEGRDLEQAVQHQHLQHDMFMAVVGTRRRLMSRCTTGRQSGWDSCFTPWFAVAEL